MYSQSMLVCHHFRILRNLDFRIHSFIHSFIHDRDLSWIREADVVVAEVSVPSLGVGYEIGRAIDLGKKTFCLYRQQEGKRLSAMIAGCPDVTIRTYENKEEAEDILREFFAS